MEGALPSVLVPTFGRSASSWATFVERMGALYNLSKDTAEPREAVYDLAQEPYDVYVPKSYDGSVPYGLIAYVYGEQAPALAVAQRIDAGMVAVNRAVLSDPAAPFGGMKQSGLGREGSSEGILEFLEEKYIGIDL